MNWYLKQVNQNAEVVHKFTRGTVIKPLQILTVSASFCLTVLVLCCSIYVYRVDQKFTFSVHHTDVVVPGNVKWLS